MTKQEEIREGIEAILIGSPDNDSPEKLSKEMLNYLHSQGVVIKVEKDSFYTNIPLDKVPLSGNTAYVETKEIIKAGYEAVASLIGRT